MSEYKRLELATEVKHSLEHGMRQVSMPALDAELQALGYKRTPGSQCACVARNMTTGNTYPCVTWGVQEIDTGMSACHYMARRDANFERLQELRFSTFAVARGQYVSI